MKFCICAEFLGTKLPEKSNLETPAGVPTKAQFRARYVVIIIMVTYIPPFNFYFLIFISILLKITETRCDWKPVCYFWINTLFVVWGQHVHVSKHFKVCTHLLPSYGWIFRKPVDISRCTSCVRFKYIDLRDCAIIIRRGGDEKLELSSKNLDSTPPSKQKKISSNPPLLC